MAAALHCHRQGIAGSRMPGHRCQGHIYSRSRGYAIAVQARQRSGPSGINVQGYSPTSPKGWEMMRQALQAANVKVISPQEVKFAIDRGAVIVDVRPEGDFDAGHIPGALNVPFYQPITGWSPFKVARRVGYALFGVLNGTEVNPNFVSDVKQLLGSPTDKPLIVYCRQGGVLEPTEDYKKGRQTRSASHSIAWLSAVFAVSGCYLAALL
eukprot:GHRR01014006.1.p1 GENE.GHRR01014006.1~~GHRR01014006.1.p1  ORF type:complete len:210 (+),score=37.42 GHRR01014006.1:237-866(+)